MIRDIFVLAAGLSLIGAAPAPATDWAAIARQDVLAAYQQYVDNHPGWHDPANAGFRAQLGRARDAGLRVAARATDQAAYAEALGAFSAELEDGHALAAANPPDAGAQQQQQEWPGFVAAWRGMSLFVHHSPAGAPPVGAEIVACDGRPVAELVRLRLRNRGLRTREAGAWWARAHRAFTSSPSFRDLRPQRCTFRTEAGEREMTLSWAPAPADLSALMRRASDGERTPIGLTEPRPGLFLVGLPDFDPDEQGVNAYRALFEALDARRRELLAAKAVVLDLRYNNGGSSNWSRQTADALWGEEEVGGRVAGYEKGAAIWWRASAGNVAYMAELEGKLRKNGETAFADEMHAVGAGMKDALGKGEMFFVERPAPRPPLRRQTDPGRFEAPVYVVTPGGCASACLDALDVFKLFPNVRLIGAPTSADTTYMDVRIQDLPSGRGKMVIPNKVYSGRPRGSGIFYRPDIEMTALDWSTAAFLDRIEQDLAARR